MTLTCKFFVLFSLFSCYLCYNIKPGPLIIATKGEVWPKPQIQVRHPGFAVLRPQIFKFQATDQSCNILQKAFERYMKIIINSTNLGRRSRRAKARPAPKTKTWNEDPLFEEYLDLLNVQLTQPCQDNQIPNADMEENYVLNVNWQSSGANTLTSNSIWGILRGLESFSQLLYLADDGIALQINTTLIEDYPRYHHRGLLLDTSRHFMPMFNILQILDGMAYNKLNVFHWHIVDDQSFPYQSKVFPELSEKGAYHPEYMIYTPKEVQKVIRHAALRGIRVMAEFDTPGHTRSWGEGRPELLTPCYKNSKPDGYLGPMDPTKTTTYDFMKTLLQEVSEVFPEKYIHLGGDEVDFDCWESNPDITTWMENNNMVGNYAELEEYYIQKVVDLVDDLNASSVVWEEVYANHVRLPKDTIVHVWISGDNVLPNTTREGYRTIWSACWYLDHLATGGDWIKYYRCDPNVNFNLTPEQRKYVIGGETCMWAESVDATNVVQRIFPRASAVAERLWSDSNVIDISDAQKRLEEHTCRMNFRGIPAQPPNGPGVCL